VEIGKMIKRVVVLFLVSAVSIFCDSCNREEGSTGTFTNPLLPSGADPWIFYDNGFYYYTNTLQDRIGIWRTRDITQLKKAEYKTVFIPPEGAPYSHALWAPEIMKIDGKWYVYFAADDGDHFNHRMFVLENDSPDPFQGEFRMKGKIQTDAEDNWAIDGSVFRHQGETYFIWSGWEITPWKEAEVQRIYIARMKNPWSLSTGRVELSRPVYDWERVWENPAEWGNMPGHIVYVNEGPEVLVHGDRVFLIYSASGCWTPHYCLGMLTAQADSDLLDPDSWTKHPEPVFRHSPENGVYGTGHNCFFKSPDGSEDWFIYHANDRPDQGCGKYRSPRAQRILWKDDGTPDFGVPLSTSERIPKPSGLY
jgi:GH43 family beta-xylosidase